MIKEIVCHSKLEHTDTLAAYLPGGDLFVSKKIEGSTFRNLLSGLACELLNAEAYLKVLQQEFIPDQTVAFLSEWEKALSIPDDCFDGEGTDDIRRRDILAKLASLGVQTVEDFEALALIFGIVVNVESGIASNETFPLTFPVIFPLDDAEARFTIIVQFTTTAGVFPYTFPITLGDDSIIILECLFNKLKPANCQVIFRPI